MKRASTNCIFWGNFPFRWQTIADIMPTVWVRTLGFSVGPIFIGVIWRDKTRERQSVDAYVAMMKEKGIQA